MISEIMQRLSLCKMLIGLRIKQRKLNKLTSIIDPKLYIVIYTKGILVKAKGENGDRVVTRNIPHFCTIPKDAVFPSSTSDETDNDIEYTRHESNDNHNLNDRCYSSRNRQLLATTVLL